MNELIQSVERRQLRPAPAVPGGRPRARPLPGGRGQRRRTQVFEGVVLKSQGPARAGRSRCASFRSGWAWSARSRCTRQRSSDRGDGPRRGAPRQALLPARPHRPPRAGAREPRLPPGGRAMSPTPRGPGGRRRRRAAEAAEAAADEVGAGGDRGGPEAVEEAAEKRRPRQPEEAPEARGGRGAGGRGRGAAESEEAPGGAEPRTPSRRSPRRARRGPVRLTQGPEARRAAAATTRCSS